MARDGSLHADVERRRNDHVVSAAFQVLSDKEVLELKRCVHPLPCPSVAVHPLPLPKTRAVL